MRIFMFRKGLIVSVLLLFIGMSVQPAIATVEPEEEIIDVNSKNYLFQTIINIANNPDIKNLLEQYIYDLLRIDIDRSVYRKLLLRNPRLITSFICSKPRLTCEFLDKCCNMGIEITKIIGENKVLEIIESYELIDKELYYELNNIILEDEELPNRLSTLKKMNKELNPVTPFMNHPIQCFIGCLILISSSIICFSIDVIYDTLEFFDVMSILKNLLYDIKIIPAGLFMAALWVIIILGCF